MERGFAGAVKYIYIYNQLKLSKSVANNTIKVKLQIIDAGVIDYRFSIDAPQLSLSKSLSGSKFVSSSGRLS